MTHPDVDEHFKARMDSSAKAEATIAAALKRAGYWVSLSPEHDGDGAYADIYVRTESGKTIAQVEVKSRNLQFHSPDTFPYPDAALVTKNRHKEWRDYVIYSTVTQLAIVSARGAVRLPRTQADNSRGVAGTVFSAPREALITWKGYLWLLKERANER